jgi:hypothetical protein
MKFQLLTTASIKVTVFWDAAPCGLVVYRRFRGAYCLHHQGETSLNFYQTTRHNIPETVIYNKNFV